MPKSHSRYAPEYRRRMVELMRAGCGPEDLAKEFTRECELLGRRRFPTQVEARMAVFEFIEGWYNPHRLHSALDYRSPINYERTRYAKNLTASPPPSTEPG